MISSMPDWLTPEDHAIVIRALRHDLSAHGVIHDTHSISTLYTMLDGDRRDADQTVARGVVRAVASRIVQLHAMQEYCLPHPFAVY